LPIDKFISEHLLNKEVEIYLGDSKDVLDGKIVGSTDGVITILKEGKMTYISAPQIKCIWEK
jgi:hypothetical protein